MQAGRISKEPALAPSAHWEIEAAKKIVRLAMQYKAAIIADTTKEMRALFGFTCLKGRVKRFAE